MVQKNEELSNLSRDLNDLEIEKNKLIEQLKADEDHKFGVEVVFSNSIVKNITYFISVK